LIVDPAYNVAFL